MSIKFISAALVGHFDPGSPAWHAARAKGLGGSEIAPVLGLSPFESRFSLWHRKTGMANPVAETDVMYWGKLLERTVREEFNRRHFSATGDGHLEAHEAGTWRHNARPWQIANPDGFVWRSDQHANWGTPDSLLEIKTARTDDGWGEEGTDQIPIYYRTQVLWYLDVFGLDLCHVAVLIGGSEYREYQVNASADEAAFMRERAVDFLGTVERRERPDIDAHDQTYQVIRELHPDIEDVKFEAPASVAVPYLRANEAFKAAEEEKRRATAALADAAGNARRVTYLGDQIADRRSKGGGLPYLQSTTRKATGQKVSTS